MVYGNPCCPCVERVVLKLAKYRPVNEPPIVTNGLMCMGTLTPLFSGMEREEHVDLTHSCCALWYHKLYVLWHSFFSFPRSLDDLSFQLQAF